jgi:hypothetical protein
VYFGTRDIEERLRRLCPELDAAAFAEIARLLGSPRLAKIEPVESDQEERHSKSG